jgi:hypothetical protein
MQLWEINLNFMGRFDFSVGILAGLEQLVVFIEVTGLKFLAPFQYRDLLTGARHA